MEFKTFTAGPDDNDRRLDRIIRTIIPKDSLSSLYKAIRKGLIKVNDSKTSAESHIFQGDKISIAAFLFESSGSEPKKNENNSKNIPLDIVFQNEHILVVNKPYDTTVQGDKDSLNKIVQKYYEETIKTESISFKTGPLHRLDRKTTGLLCFSLSLKGARWFSENIATHNIKKIYSGIIQGKLLSSERWEDSLLKKYDKEESFQTVKVGLNANESKTAITEVIPVSCGRWQNTDFTHTQFKIETGRTHQIRAQSAFHNHPLLGDTAYGGKKIPFTEYFLHAETLIFPKDNPLNLPEKITAPLPENFQKFLGLK